MELGTTESEPSRLRRIKKHIYLAFLMLCGIWALSSLTYQKTFILLPLCYVE